MRKLTLDIDQLQVTSFTTDADELDRRRGTVKGNSLDPSIVYGCVTFGTCGSCTPIHCQPIPE